MVWKHIKPMSESSWRQLKQSAQWLSSLGGLLSDRSLPLYLTSESEAAKPFRPIDESLCLFLHDTPLRHTTKLDRAVICRREHEGCMISLTF